MHIGISFPQRRAYDPPQILGHGLPIAQTGSGRRQPPTGSAAHRFARPSEFGREECSLSDAMKQARWSKLLPPAPILEKYIKDKLAIPYVKLDTFIQLTYIFTSFLFLAAAIGLFNRFVTFMSTPKLKEQENPAESGRVFTDILGYYVAPFILTLVGGSTSLYKLIKNVMDNSKKLKKIMPNYEKMRKDFIDRMKLKMVFLALTEMIYEIKNTPPGQLSPEKERAFERKISKKLFLLDLDPNLFSGKNAAEIDSLRSLPIIEKIKLLLLKEEFSPIFDEIKKEIKDYILHIKGQSILQPNSYQLHRNYCSRIDSDTEVEKLLLEIIGDISAEKRRHSSSIFIEERQLLEEKMLSSIKEALNEYLNDLEDETTLANPYDINLKKLAVLINIRIRDHFPSLMIQGFPQSVPTMPPPAAPLPLFMSSPSAMPVAYVPQPLAYAQSPQTCAFGFTPGAFGVAIPFPPAPSPFGGPASTSAYV